MKRSFALIAVLAFAASACATLPTPDGPGPAGPVAIPSTPLELGDWQRTSVGDTLASFQRNVSSRYAAGLQTSAASSDLRRQDFNCSSHRDDRATDPPAQICRKTQTASGCTHTWQVHLFGDDTLSRTRGLYDRRCGDEGLLGGPT